MKQIIGLVELGLAIWVAYDASKLGAKRGRLGGGMLDMGPVGWFFCCFLCFIVGFVCYLVTRPKLVDLRDSSARTFVPVAPQFNQFGSPHPSFAPAPPVSPPAGWYPDPGGSAASRWWDGNTWTSHTQ